MKKDKGRFARVPCIFLTTRIGMQLFSQRKLNEGINSFAQA